MVQVYQVYIFTRYLFLYLYVSKMKKFTGLDGYSERPNMECICFKALDSGHSPLTGMNASIKF